MVRADLSPDRAVRQRLLVDAEFLDDTAILAKRLNAIVDAVADIDETVIRQTHAVHRIAEALRQWRAGAVAGKLFVDWRSRSIGACSHRFLCRTRRCGD